MSTKCLRMSTEDAKGSQLYPIYKEYKAIPKEDPQRVVYETAIIQQVSHWFKELSHAVSKKILQESTTFDNFIEEINALD